MNKLSTVMSILILIGLLSATPICTKHATDGSLGDWGLNALKDSATWDANSTWLPNSGIYFVVEDNYNPNAGPGNPPGVHIRGTSNQYVFYDEPQVRDSDGNLQWEPYGHENYDIEAFYFDQDVNCTYITVITSEPPDAIGWGSPGDLAMDFDNDVNTGTYGYEYGVKLGSNTGLTQFGLYYLPNWQDPPTIPENRPSQFDSGQYLGNVMGVYKELKDNSGNGVYDRGYPNYIIQLAIPKTQVGNPDAQIGNFYLSEYCGNDHVPAPEFPFILVPLAITAIAPLLGYYISRKQN